MLVLMWSLALVVMTSLLGSFYLLCILLVLVTIHRLMRNIHGNKPPSFQGNTPDREWLLLSHSPTFHHKLLTKPLTKRAKQFSTSKLNS